MEALLFASAFVGLGGAALLGAVLYSEFQTRIRTWQTVRLQFGRDVTSDAVFGALTRIAGLAPQRVVMLDVRADGRGVQHYLATDQATMETLRGALRATLPTLRLLPTDASDNVDSYGAGRVIRLRGRLKTLRVGDHEQTSAAVVAALQPLGTNEQLLVRWTLRPSRSQVVPSKQGEQLVPSDDRRLLRQKNAGAMLRARGLIAVRAGHPKRAEHLLGRVSAALRTRSTAYGRLHLSPRRGSLLARELEQRPFWGTDRFAPDELAGLLGWPIDGPALPGLSLGTSPMLMPSGRIPRDGRVLGEATWSGAERPLAQPVVGALSHSLIAGPTGVGKSTLLTNLLVQDMAAGRGVVLIDGKGDTADAVLARVPEYRRGDVVVLDCASAGSLPGIRLFGSGDPALAADVVLGVLSDLFKDSWGALSERYLRAGLVAVAHDPHGTLADVPFVYSDAAYRRKLMGLLRDPLVRSTLAAYEGMSAGERAHQLAAPLNKMGALLGRSVVRTVLGQSDGALDFRAVLREQQIVIVSLAPARVGSSASRLIGAVTIFALFQAVQGRAAVAAKDRAPFMVCIDEPKALGDLPMPLDVLLEQARGLGVGISLAPQSLAQLPKSLRDAVLTNAATRIAFRQNADDAKVLARDLAGVSPEDLQDLAAFEAVARIGLGSGDVAAPVTIKTAAQTKAAGSANELRRASESRYGRTARQVDDELSSRHKVSPAAATDGVGRTRRRQS